MDILLVKVFATALAFSQVATAPDSVKTHFDPVADQEQVVSLLRAGCAQMRKAFDIEDINLDDLIATAMDDPEAVAGSHAVFRGIKIADLNVAYRQFCKNETVANSPFDMTAVIDFYNQTMALAELDLSAYPLPPKPRIAAARIAADGSSSAAPERDFEPQIPNSPEGSRNPAIPLQETNTRPRDRQQKCAT